MKQDDVKKLISRYLQRNGGKASNKSRPVSISTDINNLYVEQEYQEYLTCGIEIPDLASKLNVENLRMWNGNPDKVHTIVMTTVRSSKQ
uniref:Uncharacterized protein n=1 Tax=Trichobilharzia regenti TaxID=157069 RepID=A0AA85KFV1_TRIRE|nr:unnamed protein product [Trichobilharzia regenti]